MSGAVAVPLFIGPLVFLLGGLVVILVVLSIARLVFSLAWDLLVVAAVVLGVLWLLGYLGAGPPL
jgi:hypothetical protein